MYVETSTTPDDHNIFTDELRDQFCIELIDDRMFLSVADSINEMQSQAQLTLEVAQAFLVALEQRVIQMEQAAVQRDTV
jgi:hypothetical protein